MPTLPLTFKFNRHLKPEDWTDMNQVPQPHKILKELLQWSMENKKLNVASHWKELGESFQKIYLRDISFKDIMENTKGFTLNKQLKLLEEREATIRENKATI
ncbi:hypothetical protein O181_020012 [Austropuccinia psidii MF-1]|uniref:Uncharacterized protein n=1 Tax=Austropuccinia psidii MF-1 TaxID=1389203 RepID=A0A9Q3GUY7_9BASI|nr:hypothetical protein [Austropuccinia psidii MF-1]